MYKLWDKTIHGPIFLVDGPHSVIRLLVQVPVLPSFSAPYFGWPSATEVLTAQVNDVSTHPPQIYLVDAVSKKSDSTVCILDDAIDLQVILCSIAITSRSGHRGFKVARKNIANVDFLVYRIRRCQDLRPLLYSLSFKNWRGVGCASFRSRASCNKS